MAPLFPCVFGFGYLLLNILEDLMRLNLGQDNLPVISSGRPLYLLCQRSQLVDGVGDLFGESEDHGPDQQEEDDAAADDYPYQVFELLVDFIVQLDRARSLLYAGDCHLLKHDDGIVDFFGCDVWGGPRVLLAADPVGIRPYDHW